MRITAKSRKLTAQHHSLTQARHPDTKRFVKVSKNGNSNGSTMTLPISYGLQRILRPQAAFRWILPNLAAITPQYIEMIMRGALAGNHVQQWELFDLMFDTWPELTACAQELTYGVLRKKLIYEPFHEEDEKPTDSAVERMKLVSTALRGMEPDPSRDDCSIEGTIKDILDGWFRGVTVSEVIWQNLEAKDLGTIMAPKSTFWVHPVCFAFDQQGVLGLRETKPMIDTQWPYPSSTLSAQPQPAGLVPFPAYKFLIAIHKSKAGTALGGPLLRPLAWWWCAANFASDWLLNLSQLFGLPFRWANYDPNISAEALGTLDAMLQNMGSTGWARFPTPTTLEFLNAGERGSDHSPQGELLDRADRYARLLILGQTMTGTHGTTGKGGGQAFGEVEADVKSDRIDAAGRFAEEVINQQLVKSILMLNYGDTDEPPRIRFLEDEEAGLQEAQRDQTLAKAGLTIGVDFLRKKYGIPEPAEGEETIGGTPELPPGFGGFGQQPPFGGQQDTENPTEEKAPNEEQDVKAGDQPGHPFRGNQWTTQGGESVMVHESGETGHWRVRRLEPETMLKQANVSGGVGGIKTQRHVSYGLFDPQGNVKMDKHPITGKPMPSLFSSKKVALMEAEHHNIKMKSAQSASHTSILQSEEDKRRQLRNAGLLNKLAKLNEITDDAIFSKELLKLVEEHNAS